MAGKGGPATGRPLTARNGRPLDIETPMPDSQSDTEQDPALSGALLANSYSRLDLLPRQVAAKSEPLSTVRSPLALTVDL